jgi:hypothetical protein
VLEAKYEPHEFNQDELCFEWSTSRPDVVTITPIFDSKSNYNSNLTECSSKAIVSAVSKQPQRLTSIIFAKELKNDKLIRCDVIVDKINSIRIKHTTTHLYLEDSPECFTAEALDADGNTFSSIDGLAFEWNIIYDSNIDGDELKKPSSSLNNVLQISKFINSEYELSDSIRQLEMVGLSGHKILIEGIKTGTANVEAKLIDPFYKDMLKTPLVRLLVVANILLEPSNPVYLLIGGHVKYSVFLIKQTSVEKINLPSLQYYFESRDKSIANLLNDDPTQSIINGLKVGSTDIVLIDRNMKDEFAILNSGDQKIVVPPPTALIHVVEPDYLRFFMKNWRSWILEVGRTYEIDILVFTNKNQQIFPSENLRIDSIFELDKFKILHKSVNGSYLILKTLTKGQTQASANLLGTQHGNSLIEMKAYGKVDIEILNPIQAIPSTLIFALLPHSSFAVYEYQMTANGGSDSYNWHSVNSSVATINNLGFVKTSAHRVGKTQIQVTDTRNSDIKAYSMVYVVEPIDVQLLACPVETNVGNTLRLNIKMNSYLNENNSDMKLTPITDCSRLQFEINIKDESIFKFVSIQPHPDKNANLGICAQLVLNALKVGRSTIKITALLHNKKLVDSNELLIGSFSPLRAHKTEILLTPRSSIHFNLFDGPFIGTVEKSHQPSHDLADLVYSSKALVSDESRVSVQSIQSEYNIDKYTYFVECKASSLLNEQPVEVKFQVSHSKSSFNTCPLVFEYKINVKCQKPNSIQLKQLFVNNEDQESKWRCPIKLSSNLIVAHFERNLYIQLLVKDSNGQQFDNFTSDNLKWHIADSKYVSKSEKFPKIRSIQVIQSDEYLTILREGHETFNSNRLYFQTFDTKAILGQTGISVNLALDQSDSKPLKSKAKIQLVAGVRIQPEKLVIFNHPSNVVTMELFDGSDHYYGEIETVKSLESNIKVLKINSINEKNVIISPLANNGLANLHIYDYCVPPSIGLSDVQYEQIVFNWPPSCTAKIQIAGINSIMVTYEDDKLQVNDKLKIYVQISDATGNLIKTNYFKLMNLNWKIQTNEANSTAQLATIESNESENKEFMAVFTMNALKVGTVSVQFEAQSDSTNNSPKLIQSSVRDIQIFSPLRVQPKRIELLKGAYYQMQTTGGPNTPDTSITYEYSTVDLVIQIKPNGIVKALEVGEVNVKVKAIGNQNGGLPQYDSFEPKKTQKVYSQDDFIIAVVPLRNVHIQAPLKSIKRGNEMPIYLMCNDLTLSPLNFGSSDLLKYSWKVNDPQIGVLNHKLLLSNQYNVDSQSISSFSFNFKALQTGSVKISVEVSYFNKVYSDYIEIVVFDEGHFIHLPLSYLNAKSANKLQFDSFESVPNINTMLVSPGSEFFVQTNLDHLGNRITYELRFFSRKEDDSIKYCNENSIQISSNGKISIKNLEKKNLKHFKECTIGLVAIISSADFAEQTIFYSIRVKPIAYTMLKLKSIAKQAADSKFKYKLTSEVMLKNKFALLSEDIKMKWQFQFYDDLGDQFDMITTMNQFRINRNDLVDIMQLKALPSTGSLFSESLNLTSLTQLTNMQDTQFSLKTLAEGRFIMELLPNNVQAVKSQDYLDLEMRDFQSESTENENQIQANVGDLICINQITTTEHQNLTQIDQSNSIKLVPGTQSIYVCLNEGRSSLRNSFYYDVLVKPMEKVELVSKQKYFSNSIDHIRIQIQTKKINFESSSNCTNQLEQFNTRLSHEYIPFKCYVSLYSKSNVRLEHLERLILTNINLLDQQWTCEVSFIPNSDALFYDLIQDEQSEPVSMRVNVQSKYLKEETSQNQLAEPFITAFQVQTKQIKMYVSRSNYASCFTLKLRASNQLKSTLILTSNCPTIIQIKPLRTKSSTNGLFTISYEITFARSFDLAYLISTLQQQTGQLHVKVMSSLTEQTEYVPITFIYGDTIYGNEHTENYFHNPFNWLWRITSDQLISFIFTISLVVITIACLLKLKSSQAAEKIALNATAASAALAASAYRSTGASQKDHSTFNPYSYFNESANESFISSPFSPEIKPRLSPQSTSFGRRSPREFSDQTSSPLSRSLLRDQPTQQFSPNERFRLFSVGDSARTPDDTLYRSASQQRSFLDDTTRSSNLNPRRVPPDFTGY